MAQLKIDIRPATERDIGKIIELLQSLSEFKPSHDEYPNLWRNFAAQNNVYALVATIQEELVGYGSLVIETKIRGGKAGHIEDIVTHPNHQKSGVGRLIVNSLCELAQANGCYKASLQCREHNIKFYEKCLFVENGSTMQRQF